ncbi:tRNA dimethylallyltransferase [Thrips palmi]|uniref:tRNA dimethylallyltransferase n=1 Tax=Thrips palmi TaxID=161013 RepID=A0A6P8ZXG3_THRPL|nr:tRNA dimethylallyltransferase [Thrips palmi]
MAGVPHHLLGHLQPGDNYHVHRFRAEAFRIIESLHARNKVPVVVGGTHYYVESILWKNLVGNSDASDSTADGQAPRKRPHRDQYVIAGRTFANLDDLEKLGTEELREILKEIDPASWELLQDRRKIRRSIEVFGQTGRRHSDILEEQRQAAGSVHGGALRYPKALVFWMQCDKDTLNARLARRVDAMLAQGLLEEVEAFHQQVNLKRGEQQSQDFEHSLFQSIGFKEMLPYAALSAEERASEAGKKALEQGLLLLKQRNMRYARKQEAWIRNRLLVHGRDVPPVWPLDGSDPSRWDELVAAPAAAVVEARLRGEDPDEAVIRAVPKEGTALPAKERHATYRCELCQRDLMGLQQYNIHLGTKKHRAAAAKLKKAQSELAAVLDAAVQRGDGEAGDGHGLGHGHGDEGERGGAEEDVVPRESEASPEGVRTTA